MPVPQKEETLTYRLQMLKPCDRKEICAFTGLEEGQGVQQWRGGEL